MIAHLTGIVLSKSEKSVVLNVQDTGYLVAVPRTLLEKIQLGEKLSLHIHTHVREDDISLYGFPSSEAWEFFRLLLTVSGIGPKSGLEMMSAPLVQVRQAIAKKDVAYLTRIPGIGKKTAERIIVDLQGKIKEELLGESADEGGSSNEEELITALMTLGFPRQHVIQRLKKVPSNITGEEAIIKYFLQHT